MECLKMFNTEISDRILAAAYALLEKGVDVFPVQIPSASAFYLAPAVDGLVQPFSGFVYENTEYAIGPCQDI